MYFHAVTPELAPTPVFSAMPSPGVYGRLHAGGVERSRLCRSSPRASPDDGLQFGEAVFHVPSL